MKNGICPNCDGRVIMNGVNIMDRGEANMPHDLCVVIHSKPQALFFSGPVYGQLRATICGTCGFTELYASNIEALVEAAEMQADDEK